MELFRRRFVWNNHRHNNHWYGKTVSNQIHSYSHNFQPTLKSRVIIGFSTLSSVHFFLFKFKSQCAKINCGWKKRKYIRQSWYNVEDSKRNEVSLIILWICEIWMSRRRDRWPYFHMYKITKASPPAQRKSAIISILWIIWIVNTFVNFFWADQLWVKICHLIQIGKWLDRKNNKKKNLIIRSTYFKICRWRF